MERSPDGYEFRPITIELGRIPFLSVVQIQPTLVNLDGNDYLQRESVFTSIISWLIQPSQDTIRAGRVQTESPYALQPEMPFLLCFPELYLPLSLLLELGRSNLLKAGSIIMSGICPMEAEGPSEQTFALGHLVSTKTKLEAEDGIKIENLDHLDGLISHITHHGGTANLAATMAVDKNKITHIVLHAKIAPSKFERNLDLDANTVPGFFLHPIVLKSESGPNQEITILPLICSDFFTKTDHDGKLILSRCHETRPRLSIDIVSVLSLQRTNDTSKYLHPYPDIICDVLAFIAGNLVSPSPKHSHVLMTNANSFSEKSHVHNGGFSCFCVFNSNGNLRDSLAWLSPWQGQSFLYGQARDTTSNLIMKTWFKKDDPSFVPVAAPMVSMISPAHQGVGEISKIQALGQTSKFLLNQRIGPEAVQAGQLLWSDGCHVYRMKRA